MFSKGNDEINNHSIQNSSNSNKIEKQYRALKTCVTEVMKKRVQQEKMMSFELYEISKKLEIIKQHKKEEIQDSNLKGKKFEEFELESVGNKKILNSVGHFGQHKKSVKASNSHAIKKNNKVKSKKEEILMTL